MELAVSDRVARPWHGHDDGIGLQDDYHAQVVAAFWSTVMQMPSRLRAGDSRSPKDDERGLLVASPTEHLEIAV